MPRSKTLIKKPIRKLYPVIVNPINPLRITTSRPKPTVTLVSDSTYEPRLDYIQWKNQTYEDVYSDSDAKEYYVWNSKENCYEKYFYHA